ncbi:hypothetical protein [Nocardioides sp. CFH 31398]|uniref:hypothetical protein n=1 Tax=Nocardioides sp. CFH 31398 TaxID=2919579 RepID=UPI001F06A9AD|nr:hypothetical protein [Nocardioides sp. CFH 31398]MCH1865564.1 hypothetical protein [Nocardioides sp. CFH 31398]
MSQTTGRRRAAPPTSGRGTRWRERLEALRAGRVPVVAWFVLVGLGVVLLGLRAADLGPRVIADVGSVVIASAYSWALAARTGGRPVLFGSLAAVLATTAVVTDLDELRTGAAVLTCTVGAVLGVMVTVPARRFRVAVREVLVATVIGAVGAFASIGFEPVVRLGRFEYVTLALALAGSFAVVWRLGAGLHGLGRRGLVVVLGGAVLLAVALGYAELLRSYGPPGAVESVLSRVSAVRADLGAVPRPTQAFIGVPALVWGCHMRARRRQGWWVCAFGVAALLPVAHGLVNPAASVLEVALSTAYGLVIGLALGYAVIRLDLALTGPRGARARREEEASARRPEPSRTRALL